jgi:hypothetical protein
MACPHDTPLIANVNCFVKPAANMLSTVNVWIATTPGARRPGDNASEVPSL